MSWAADEFATVELGDKRLNSRLVKLAQQLAAKPTASIPAACGGWGDTAAAYRMLNNERCDWREIIESHGRCAMHRMAELPVVLCLHDTTELDFNGQTIQGLGPLSYEAQRGMYLHPTYAVSTDREPLGVLDAWMWAREPREAGAQRGGLCESTRWVESYERLAERAADLPATRLVQVGDRESDMLALMQCAQALRWPVDVLVRSQHNRRLPDGQLMWDAVQSEAVLGEIEFTLGARAGRRARVVRQELRWRRVVLHQDAGGAIEMTCLVASEVAAPAGDKPVCWRLLTNREVTTLEQAHELIEWYRARWEIEMFFHVLKTGCRVEALQLASLPKIERALALFMVVSWRIARLMRLGRTCPDLPASLMFEPEEIQAAYVLTQKPLPETPPSLNDVVRRVAMLGGFLARKHDGEPGVKTDTDFDFESASNLLALLSQLTNKAIHLDEIEQVVDTIGMRFCSNRSLTELLSANARVHPPYTERMKSCQAKVLQFAETAMALSMGGNPTAAVKNLVIHGKQTLNSRLIDNAYQVLQKHGAKIEGIEQLAIEVQALRERYGLGNVKPSLGDQKRKEGGLSLDAFTKATQRPQPA